jgi:hypothetical protein
MRKDRLALTLSLQILTTASRRVGNTFYLQAIEHKAINSAYVVSKKSDNFIQQKMQGKRRVY